MRKIYESPVMFVEKFAANSAVSTCTVEGGISYDFDCMYGPNVDTKNVISSQIPNVTASCNLSIGYAGGITTARDYSSKGSHSNNNSARARWTTSGKLGQGGYLQVAYTGAEGLLYTDGSADNDKCWTVETGYVKHSSSRGGTHHMVAPVVDSRTINASW